MPHADVHPVGMIHQFQELEHRIQIVHGLADPHEHDVGDLQPGIQLGKEHLIQHFGRGQIADLSGNGGCAERAAHPAAHLGGDAYRVAVVIAHEDGLNAVAVRQFP